MTEQRLSSLTDAEMKNIKWDRNSAITSLKLASYSIQRMRHARTPEERRLAKSGAREWLKHIRDVMNNTGFMLVHRKDPPLFSADTRPGDRAELLNGVWRPKEPTS